MKNKEKYAKEIIELVLKEGMFAIDKTNNNFEACGNIPCADCLFRGNNCSNNLRKWANAEYEEPKIFTNREKAFVKLFPLIKYIARNMDGDLYMFASKPEKGNSTWKAVDGYAWWIQDFMCLNFNSITWNDEEPTSREEILGS